MVDNSGPKHGVRAEGALLAATKYMVAVDLDEENPGRQLRLGFSAAGQLLETVVLTFDSGRELVIHAMKARAKYSDLLLERREGYEGK
ncbi:toxin [Arthrobacter sp. CG_A4]|uniref:toxin n=1 Tax=Arthrobacter sp. CG_A4 TaxID=3071706 RepID=UPI002E15AD58